MFDPAPVAFLDDDIISDSLSLCLSCFDEAPFRGVIITIFS